MSPEDIQLSLFVEDERFTFEINQQFSVHGEEEFAFEVEIAQVGEMFRVVKLFPVLGNILSFL